MGAWHVLGHRGVAPLLVGAQVGGDAPAAMEQLDGLGGDPRLDLLADQLMRDRVVVPGDLDVVVDAGSAFLPLGILVGPAGQRLAGPADRSCSKQCAAAGAELP